jgi:FixJ family two-component response regulator
MAPAYGSSAVSVSDDWRAAKHIENTIAIQEVFGCLCSREQQALANCAFGGTDAELADKLGVSRATAQRIRTRALEQARRLLN